jgi:xanthine dehydrogenase accessory factor
MSLESTNEVAARWLSDGRRVVAATLVDTQGSAPLDPGATMLVDEELHIEGSVTGGCVEGALVEEAQASLRGEGPRLRTYGISDSEAADVGLMCGGTVHIFVHELDSALAGVLDEMNQAVAERRPVVIATLLDGEKGGRKLVFLDGKKLGGLETGSRLDDAVSRDAEACVAHGVSVVRAYGSGGEVMGSELRVFIQAFATPPKMVIFGAIDFSAAVALFAKHLGYEVTICDARRPFAMGSRFSPADHVIVDWPDRYLASQELGNRDVVLVFTHDAKFDEPALVSALETDVGYIGALGSRRTHEDRKERLLAAGVSEADLDRIQAPSGLDIGARSPEETAISVLAEIIGRSTGRIGEPLSETSGPIHPPQTLPAELR